MKKIRVWIFSVLIIALLSITVFADDSITSSNLFLFGKDAKSQEKVIGDVYAFAKGVEVLESVNGDVISAGKDIDIKSDRVLGNIRGLGQYIDIDVKNTKNITVAGQKIKISEESVSNAVYVAGQSVEFNGTTNDLYIAGNNVVIDGIVNGNLDIRGKNIIIGENACVYGDIKIKSENEPIITGSVAWKDIDYETINYKSYFEQSNIGIFSKVMNIVSSVIVAVIMFIMAKSYFLKLNSEVNTYIGKYILIGVALFIGIPISIVILTLSIVGFPISLILIGIYLSIIYLAPMYSGIIVGKKLLRNNNEYIQVIVGVLLIKVMLMLPYVKTIVDFLCCIFMMGSLFIFIKRYIKKI